MTKCKYYRKSSNWTEKTIIVKSFPIKKYATIPTPRLHPIVLEYSCLKFDILQRTPTFNLL